MPVKGGKWKEARGPKDEKTFWFLSKQGNVILGYRRGEKLSSEGLFGPSPIQALQQHENASELRKYMDDTLRKRVEHQLDRLNKG